MKLVVGTLFFPAKTEVLPYNSSVSVQLCFLDVKKQRASLVAPVPQIHGMGWLGRGIKDHPVPTSLKSFRC